MTTPLPNPTPVRRGHLTAAAKRAAIVASILLPILTPLTPCALAQPMRDRSPSAPPAGSVELNLAGELELGILIDLISDRLGINIVSSSQAESKKIRIRAPESIPDAALMSLLELSLRTHNLILAEYPDSPLSAQSGFLCVQKTPPNNHPRAQNPRLPCFDPKGKAGLHSTVLIPFRSSRLPYSRAA